MFLSFSEGMCVKELIGQHGLMFDFCQAGAVLIYMMDDDERADYDLIKPYRVHCTRIKDTLFICSKLGDTYWASAPFSPHLTADYHYVEYKEGTGMAVTALLVRSADGIIQKVHIWSFGTEFSRYFMNQCEDILDEPFDSHRHQMTVYSTYQKYELDDEIAELPGVSFDSRWIQGEKGQEKDGR